MLSISFSFVPRVFTRVYSAPQYWIISILIAVAYFLVAIMIPQWSLISYTIQTPIFTFFEKISILKEVLGGFSLLGTAASQTFSILISILVGINTSFIVYYISLRARLRKRAGGAGLLAMALSLFGIGCTTCGSVFLSSLFGLTLATGIVTFLPFHGLEFSIVSVVLLMASILYLAWSSQRPIICKI